MERTIIPSSSLQPQQCEPHNSGVRVCEQWGIEDGRSFSRYAGEGGTADAHEAAGGGVDASAGGVGAPPVEEV